MTASDEAIKIGVQDGALHFKIDDLDTIAWSTPKDKRFGDFVLDVDATQVAEPNDNTYGVIFRYQMITLLPARHQRRQLLSPCSSARMGRGPKCRTTSKHRPSSRAMPQITCR
jgi:hypothetical protein